MRAPTPATYVYPRVPPPPLAADESKGNIPPLHAPSSQALFAPPSFDARLYRQYLAMRDALPARYNLLCPRRALQLVPSL